MNGLGMITGAVNSLRRPTITVTLIDEKGEIRSLEAHLDTGFTGDLTLPASAIKQLGLPFSATTSFRTASSRLTDFRTYEGVILWHGRRRIIDVLESEVFPLVGVGLLWDNNLSIDFKLGGDVAITELLES